MNSHETTSVIRLVTCGSVDDGKSTLIGRLLVDTDSLPIDTIQSARDVRRAGSTIAAGEIDYSLLTDGLEAEREQGITIDVAYRSMALPPDRRLIISDAPGHEQYTRNMVVAASRADVALVLLDTTRGIRSQTIRHLTICALLNVPKIIVVFNKLDAFDYSSDKFNELAGQMRTLLETLDIFDYELIPVSALAGANVTTQSDQTPWYKGPTLLDAISSYQKPSPKGQLPIMGVQTITRADNYRAVSGSIGQGIFRAGDKVSIFPRGQKATVSEITTYEGTASELSYPASATFVLTPEVDAARGDILFAAQEIPESASQIRAHAVWFAEDLTAKAGNEYILISGVQSTPVTISNISRKYDLSNGKKLDVTELGLNDIGVIELSILNPIFMTEYSKSRTFGNFILVDRQSNATIAAGMVEQILHSATNITRQEYAVTEVERSRQKGQSPRVIWFTGLSGAGKSTIADGVEKALFARGKHVYVLDGDNVRLGLNKNLGFSREDRQENVRRVAEVAKLMMDAGLIVIVSLVSPYRADRDQAREICKDFDFVEVWVDTPSQTCQERDPKGLYKKAKSGAISNFTGVGQVYEEPLTPEIHLDGTAPIEVSVSQVIDFLA